MLVTVEVAEIVSALDLERGGRYRCCKRKLSLRESISGLVGQVWVESRGGILERWEVDLIFARF